MNTLQKAEGAPQLYQQLVATIRLRQLTGISLGKTLWQLKANNAFKNAIGAGIETWNDFLKLPEISLEVREANRAMDLYETFVVKYEFPIDELAEAKIKSLHYLLPLVKEGLLTEARIHELVEDAKHLTQNQFRENIFDAKETGASRTYQFVLMRKCNETGTMQRVPDIDNTQIIVAFDRVGIHLFDKFMPEIL